MIALTNEAFQKIAVKFGGWGRSRYRFAMIAKTVCGQRISGEF